MAGRQGDGMLLQTLHLCYASLRVSLLCVSWNKKSRRVNTNPDILIPYVHSYVESIAGVPKDWHGAQLRDLCTAPFSPGVPCLFLSPLIPKANFFFLRSSHPPPHSHMQSSSKTKACTGPVYLEHKHIQASDVRLKEERGKKSKPLNCT